MSRPLVITKLVGGLGNQLFQYALGRHLADLNRGVLKLDVSAFDTYKLHAYSLHHFCISADVASEREISKFSRLETNRLFRSISSCPAAGIRRLGNHLYVREQSLAYDDRILGLQGNLYLDGYWQSERYFESIREQLRQELIVKPAPNAANQEMASRINSGPSASIHVRLGDYASNSLTKKTHGVLSADYYKRAIARVLSVQPEAHFFLFSDEPEKAVEKIELPESKVTQVVINDAKSNFEDLRLMTLAEHHIIANSSFSWWGAWLRRNQDGIVVAPSRWFLDGSRDASDILPAGWVML